jgi:hypothetical protein
MSSTRTSIELHLSPVDPIGTETREGFWDGHDDTGNHVGGYGSWDSNVYPPSPFGQEIRKLRLKHNLSLREASERLRITVVQLSHIEQGQLTADEMAQGAIRAALAPDRSDTGEERRRGEQKVRI